jgi:hypothetical protein
MTDPGPSPAVAPQRRSPVHRLPPPDPPAAFSPPPHTAGAEETKGSQTGQKKPGQRCDEHYEGQKRTEQHEDTITSNQRVGYVSGRREGGQRRSESARQWSWLVLGRDSNRPTVPTATRPAGPMLLSLHQVRQRGSDRSTSGLPRVSRWCPACCCPTTTRGNTTQSTTATVQESTIGDAPRSPHSND